MSDRYLSSSALTSSFFHGIVLLLSGGLIACDPNTPASPMSNSDNTMSGGLSMGEGESTGGRSPHGVARSATVSMMV